LQGNGCCSTSRLSGCFGPVFCGSRHPIRCAESIAKWQKRNSRSYWANGEKVKLDSETDQLIGRLAPAGSVIVVGPLLFLLSRGSREAGILLLYGLTGLGILVGIFSLILSGSSRSSKRSDQDWQAHRERTQDPIVRHQNHIKRPRQGHTKHEESSRRLKKSAESIRLSIKPS
jgi:hypothetical protein